MNVTDFLSECSHRGIDIKLDGDALVIHPTDIQANTVDYIRQHKPEIMAVLNAPAWNGEHGACVGCGEDTASMLTTPFQSWRWECVDCFDKRHAAHSKNATAAIV